jgi:hypothetical protein
VYKTVSVQPAVCSLPGKNRKDLNEIVQGGDTFRRIGHIYLAVPEENRQFIFCLVAVVPGVGSVTQKRISFYAVSSTNQAFCHNARIGFEIVYNLPFHPLHKVSCSLGGCAASVLYSTDVLLG